MNEFDIDWDVEDGPAFTDAPGFDETYGLNDSHDPMDSHGIGAGDGPEDGPGFADAGDEPVETDDPLMDGDVYADLVEGNETLEGAYELLGADPDEEELWNQIMLDLNDEVNPYVAN